MRTFTFNIIATLSLAACEPASVKFVLPEEDGHTESVSTAPAGTEPYTENLESIETNESPSYLVASSHGVVHETDTRLEYVDGYSYSVYTDNVPMDCIVVTLRVPEDAGQGVIIKSIEYGAHGYDANQTGWMDDIYTIGAGHDSLPQSAFEIFHDPSTNSGAVGYPEDHVVPLPEAWETNWAILDDCWVDACENTANLLVTNHYVSPGEISLGFCALWQADDSLDEQWNVPGPEDTLTAVIGEIRWTPADRPEGLTSPYIYGLLLPATSRGFPDLW